MEQKNHFTIKDEGGRVMVDIIRRPDVSNGDLVELLQLFVESWEDGEDGETQGGVTQPPGEKAEMECHLRLVKGRIAAAPSIDPASPLGILLQGAGLDKVTGEDDPELAALKSLNYARRVACGMVPHTSPSPEEPNND